MLFVPIPNTAKIELVYNIDGQVIENVMHFVGDHSPTADDLVRLAEDARLQWYSTWRVHQCAGCQLTSIKATDASQEDGAAIEYTTSLPAVGAKGDELMSNNVTACISMKTAKRGRSYRGRIYLPGISVNDVATNSLSNDLLNGLTDSFSYWNFLDNDGEPWALAVASKFHNGAPRTTGVATPVLNFLVNRFVASQRRRLPGRGR